MFLKDSWKSILSWSFISTIIFLVLSLIFSPYMDKSPKGIMVVIVALFIASFFVFSMIVLFTQQFKIFKSADSQGKINMIILAIVVIGYVLPKAIEHFKK